MKKAIIFDFDGVLVLSEKARFEAIQSAASKYHVKIDNVLFTKLVGKTTHIFLNEILSSQNEHHLTAIIKSYEENYKKNIELFVKPNALLVDFIKEYNGPLYFAIASMSSRNIVEKLLIHFGIASKFFLITSKEDIIHQKPDPEIYLLTASKLRISVKECLALEDSRVGVVSALSAGMKCCVVLNGINKQIDFENLHIEKFIRSRNDLENLVKE
jgi:putative hydrolase of the HAD superfamily